jgi:hypothetical protein
MGVEFWFGFFCGIMSLLALTTGAVIFIWIWLLNNNNW